MLLFLFSRSVVSNSLQPYGLQQARFPCPSPAPGACSKLMSIESEMPSSHRILCHPLLLLPSIFPSIRVFSNELALCIRWPKYWRIIYIDKMYNALQKQSNLERRDQNAAAGLFVCSVKWVLNLEEDFQVANIMVQGTS